MDNDDSELFLDIMTPAFSPAQEKILTAFVQVAAGLLLSWYSLQELSAELKLYRTAQDRASFN